MSRPRRPSPALAVSCLALAVALGGTGYAAVTLPANSVGTKQLRNGAVIGAKVKPRSLLASNFKAGQLPRGPQGAAGLPGAAGPPGPKGDSATRLFASVKPDASSDGIGLGPSSGVVGDVARGSEAGTYNLTFNQDITACVPMAMAGGSATGALVPAQASAAPTGGAGVTVKLFDADGFGVDVDAFTLAVFC
jgi:hypothetical protein